LRIKSIRAILVSRIELPAHLSPRHHLGWHVREPRHSTVGRRERSRFKCMGGALVVQTRASVHQGGEEWEGKEGGTYGCVEGVVVVVG